MAEKRESLFNNEVVTRNVLHLLAVKGISRYQLSPKAKLSQSILSANVRGEKDWTYKSVKKIADALGVPMESITGEKEPENTQPFMPEYEHIKVYHKVAAGRDIDRWDNEDQTIDLILPEFNKVKGKKYGFIIDGDSMLERFRQGDIIVCTEYKDALPKDKDIVVIFYDTGLDAVSGNCKKFIWADREHTMFTLQPINPRHDAKTGNWEKVTRIFKVHFAITKIDYR